MSSKKRFAPEQELSVNNIPRYYRWRTLITFCIFLALIILWAVCCRSCITNSGLGGSSDFGTSSGSGNSGDGSGAGDTGDNKGKFEQAKGTSGIGKDIAPTGTDKPDNGKFAVDAAQGARKIPILTTPPIHIETIAKEVFPAAPADATANQFTGGAPAGRKGFYGVAVQRASKILFIIDCSGSMNSPSSEVPGKNRLDVLKMELEKAIFSSTATRSISGGFSIVKFSGATEIFPPPKKGLCKYSNTKRMKEAKEFIDNLYPGGGTHMKTAWLDAIEIIKKQNISTVYFLTDGEPSDGFDPVWLQETLKKGRIRHQLTVNCIAVGGRGQMLMQKIADDHKGSFVLIP